MCIRDRLNTHSGKKIKTVKKLQKQHNKKSEEQIDEVRANIYSMTVFVLPSCKRIRPHYYIRDFFWMEAQRFLQGIARHITAFEARVEGGWRCNSFTQTM